MKKPFLSLGLALLVMAAVGCSRGNPNAGPVPADKQAQTDPNGKARELFDQLSAVPAEDRPSWIRQRSMELSVFQTVTDPELRARYATEIAPYLGTP